MKYQPGERVDFIPITSTSPGSAVFQLTDEEGHPVMQPLTVSNGGLEQRRKNALHPVFNAPHVPGRYAYKFWDGQQVASGTILVDGTIRSTPQHQHAHQTAPPQQQTARPDNPRLGIVE